MSYTKSDLKVDTVWLLNNSNQAMIEKLLRHIVRTSGGVIE